MPQIEVSFDIDANGILNVSARDKATGKQQKIVIKASSGLNDEEIDRMVRDAEAHAAEDAKFRELADTRNQADALIHATEKSLAELGDKVDPSERASIESALSDVKAVAKSDNKEAIEAKLRALGEASAKLAERVYSQKQPADGDEAAPKDSASSGDENIVDAEFEEVDEDKKKRG